MQHISNHHSITNKFNQTNNIINQFKVTCILLIYKFISSNIKSFVVVE